MYISAFTNSLVASCKFSVILDPSEIDLASKEYKEWAQVSRNICTSFIHKLGVPLSKVWVFPANKNVVTKVVFFRMCWRWCFSLVERGVDDVDLDVGPDNLFLDLRFVGGSWEFGASDMGCGLSQELGAGDALLPCSSGVGMEGCFGILVELGWLNWVVFGGGFWAVW